MTSKWGNKNWADVNDAEETKEVNEDALGDDYEEVAGDVDGDDVDGDGDDSKANTKSLPERQEIGPDKDGIKTVIEYYRNKQGQAVRVTRKIKVTRRTVKLTQGVLRRRKLAKFGDCEGKAAGLEHNISTVVAENITLNLNAPQVEHEEEKKVEKIKTTSCRYCGSLDHFSLQCPSRNEMMPTQRISQAVDSVKSGASAAASGAGASSTGPKKYVPPGSRGGDRDRTREDKDEMPTLRVTNISENATEEDLKELFRPFGRLARVFLARDRASKQPRGFAFVSFAIRDDAEAALNKLNGYGYDNLILRVEWSKPREEK